MPQTSSSCERLSHSKAASLWRDIILSARWILIIWLGPGTGAKSRHNPAPTTSVVSGIAHLDRRIYTTTGRCGCPSMVFAILPSPSRILTKSPRVFIPYEPITVVGPRHDIFVIRAMEIHVLDGSMLQVLAYRRRGRTRGTVLLKFMTYLSYYRPA